MPVLFSTWGIEYTPTNDDYKIQGLEVVISNKKDKTKITTGELEKKYDYDIYYYGLEKVNVKFPNETMELKEALLSNKISMDDIIEKCKVDSKAIDDAFARGDAPKMPIKGGMSEPIDSNTGFVFKDIILDGGSIQYWYVGYSIIKKHDLSGDRDVYIGIPTMNINSLD